MRRSTPEIPSLVDLSQVRWFVLGALIDYLDAKRVAFDRHSSDFQAYVKNLTFHCHKMITGNKDPHVVHCSFDSIPGVNESFIISLVTEMFKIYHR